MPTFKLIASSAVGAGGASSITFSSIPQTYTDLVLSLSLRHDSTAGDIRIRFNGSSSSIYSRINLYNSNGSAGSNSGSSQDAFYTSGTSDPSSYTASTFSNCQFYIPNYTSSNNKSLSKDAVTENNGTNIRLELSAGLWASSSAITSITVEANDGGTAANFVQYSTAYLYGISNA